MLTSRLKDILEERGIKQSWLIKKVGISSGAMSLLVNNKSTPTLEVAFKIAKALNLHIEDVWQHVDEEKEPQD